MADTDCIFCRIAAGQIPSDVVYQDQHVTAFRDLNPQAPTHVLVIPNVHVASIAELDDADLSHQLLRAAVHVAEQEGLTNGFRVLTNSGPDAGQSVEHLHWHVLGGRHLRGGLA
ncbi:MAG TPA: histidine triad nucleotide-binding protein [Chloroflexota bacterium]|jgi:histidine triad (HIT) family protein|nr:histidine triad nucleotide-binding protein [Chloroflexota bacterium]